MFLYIIVALVPEKVSDHSRYSINIWSIDNKKNRKYCNEKIILNIFAIFLLYDSWWGTYYAWDSALFFLFKYWIVLQNLLLKFPCLFLPSFLLYLRYILNIVSYNLEKTSVAKIKFSDDFSKVKKIDKGNKLKSYTCVQNPRLHIISFSL